MAIKKFDDFINEDVKIPVLDVLIDDNGNLYNGQEGFPLRKGNIVQNKSRKLIDIMGEDRKSYPAGIDKNGVLVSVYSSAEGYVLNKEKKPILINNNLKQKYRQLSNYTYYQNDIDYSFLIPIVPTGWVNIKVDMEIIKRVRRYSKGLGTNTDGFQSFKDKLNDLKRTSSGVKLRKRSRETIQKEMSVIILLHYINEIKNFFTPSAAGFLFESFLAGLIPNAKVKEDNSKCDVYADGKKYQVKLYSSLESSLAIAYEEIKQNVNGTEVVVGINSMDYYLICLKYPDKVDIFILDGKNENSDAYYQNFRTEGINKSGQQVSQVERKFSVSSIVNNCPDSMRFSIDLINLEEKIKKIATGLKESLDDLYAELSNFQYNVETIITGVDERGDIISGQEFTALSGSAESNIESMRIKLEELVTNISGITRTNN
jgi:hypothetical protein